MAKEKFKDFDAYFAEASKTDEVKIKLFDKEYSIPLDFPAATVLELFRMVEEGEDEITDSKQLDMSMQMLGKENVQEWCEKGITVKQLGEIMKWTLSLVMADEENGKKKTNLKG